MKFSKVPNYSKVQQALTCFYGEDMDEIQQAVSMRYNLSEQDFTVLMLRFAGPFIKNKANIFSNFFERGLKNPEKIDIESLNEAEKDAERLLHLFKKVGLLVTENDENPLVGDSSPVSFKALSPLDYHHEGKYWIFNGSDGVYIFVCVSSTNQEIVELYKSDKSFSSVVEKFDTSKDDFGVGAELDEETDFGAYVPIIEWALQGSGNVVIHSLVSLEKQYIQQITWGLYNADPKMVDQKVIQSDEDTDKLKRNVYSNAGQTRKYLLLGINDKLQAYDPGDISVLLDTMKTYKEIITQRALTEGVDISAVIRLDNSTASGESKKWDLGYINRARQDYKTGAKIFDRSIFALLKENFDIDCGWENFKSPDLDLIPDKKTEAEYATYMRENGYWTYTESVAHTRGISLQDAEDFIQKNDMKPVA